MKNRKIRIALSFTAMGIGAFVLGFGIKFSFVWWFWLPNIVDGFLTIVAGLILVVIGFSYGLKIFPKRKSQ